MNPFEKFAYNQKVSFMWYGKRLYGEYLGTQGNIDSQGREGMLASVGVRTYIYTVYLSDLRAVKPRAPKVSIEEEL